MVAKLIPARGWNTIQHFAGLHLSIDVRTAFPKPFLAYYLAVIAISELDENINIISPQDGKVRKTVVGPATKTEALEERENYETSNPTPLESFGETVAVPIGDTALGRSGDKGANINLGLYVHTEDEWGWLRLFLTRDQMQEMMGDDWQEWYFIERCEMPEVKAVHFVICGPMARGVSSSKILDALGKGFGGYTCDVHVPLPRKFLKQ